MAYQIEESHRNPIIAQVRKVNGTFPTNNEALAIDLTITTDEKHKESSRALDDSVRTEDYAILFIAAREAKGLEHERNMDENAKREESTNVSDNQHCLQV